MHPFFKRAVSKKKTMIFLKILNSIPKLIDALKVVPIYHNTKAQC